MKDEIKEILRDDELLKKVENILAGELTEKEYDKFYNYFNEIRKPNIIIDIKDDENIKDYITNLQKEVRINNDLIPYLKNKEKSLKKQMTNLQEENENYKSRIEKAIEYIKEAITTREIVGVANLDINHLLNILQGSDKE